MRIDVFSDLVCPWCYLGERRLTVALADIEGGADVEVRWRAFQLDPAAPVEPRPLRPALERKYGPGSYDAMTARLGAAAPEVGIEYRFDLVQRVRSWDAMRLLAWADQTEGPATAELLLARLFKAYFTDGGNIADHGALARWAGEAGLDRGLAADALASDAGADRVQSDLHAAAELGVSAVPTFVVDGAWAIPGAQEIVTMKALLSRALTRT
jgi:predicted DsbA family dithiol-disulfide isomerase